MPARCDGDMHLGQFDVEAEVLNAPGHRLEHFIGAPGSALIDDMLGPPPADGWRLIAGDLNAPVEHQPVFAAPWDNPQRSGWMVISLWQLDGEWRAVINDDSHPLRPSRARRREGLQLDWPLSAIQQTSSLRAGARLDQVAVTLRNTSTEPWVNHHLDHDGVSILVRDERGHRITNHHPDAIWETVAIPVALLPSIEPSAELTLLARFDAATARDGLPPGTHTLVASLDSLGLETPPRPLVVESSPGTPA